jgi:hypothetical protein
MFPLTLAGLDRATAELRRRGSDGRKAAPPPPPPPPEGAPAAP